MDTDIKTLKQMLSHYYSRKKDWRAENSSIVISSKALYCVYSEEEGRITELSFNGQSVPDDTRISLGLLDYLVKNAENNFGGDIETLTGAKLVSASADIIADLENALQGREKIKLNSTHRFNRIFADHSMLCPPEGL